MSPVPPKAPAAASRGAVGASAICDFLDEPPLSLDTARLNGLHEKFKMENVPADK